MTSFKQRLRTGELLVGTFVKTTHYQIVEIVGASDLDFMVLDAEHAPFDRAALDMASVAARSVGMPTLVRLPGTSPREILDVLDVGFTGILAPHAVDPSGVKLIARACRYADGLRGFSNSPRAGGYGAVGMKAHIEHSDRDSVIVCQIEDRAAIERLDELVAVPEVDAYLIGRADLALSYGLHDLAHPDLARTVSRVIEACVAAGKTVGIFVGSPAEIAAYAKAGARLFIVGSDQSMLRAQTASVAAHVADLKLSGPG